MPRPRRKWVQRMAASLVIKRYLSLKENDGSAHAAVLMEVSDLATHNRDFFRKKQHFPHL